MGLNRRTTVAGALAALLLCGALAGCTTSRAALAWEAGWRLEAKGEPDTAMRRYADAYDRNDRLVGAELNRIRLLAGAPDKRAAAEADLAVLLTKRGEVPEVAIFGAAWALRAGDTKRAQERLAAVRVKVSKGVAGCPPLLRDLLRVDLQVTVAAARWQPAQKTLADLTARCGVSAVPAQTAALVAWNTGEATAAATWLARLPAAAPGAGLLRAMLALHAGDHSAAATLLSQVDRPELRHHVAILSAHVALARGDHAAAERLAVEALDAMPAATAPQLLLGVALLRRGDVTRARDLLAGAAARSKGTPPWTLSWNLGLAELRLAHFEQARSAFDAAARACDKGPCEVAGRNRDAMAKLGL